jgi:hypothetical protein
MKWMNGRASDNATEPYAPRTLRPALRVGRLKRQGSNSAEWVE